MQCEQVSDHLLLGDAADHAAVSRHLEACAACERLARVTRRVDRTLQAALVVEPPPALQAQLAALLAEHTAAQAEADSWWQRLLDAVRGLGQSGLPFAQSLALVAVALASWQVFSWAGTIAPSVGDVGYAMQLVATSPALAYVPNLQIDPDALGVWTLVGIAGWLVSESSPLGRALKRSGDRS